MYQKVVTRNKNFFKNIYKKWIGYSNNHIVIIRQGQQLIIFFTDSVGTVKNNNRIKKEKDGTKWNLHKW